MKSLKSFSFFFVLLIPLTVEAVSRSFPVVQLRPLYSRFSPDGDGVQDFLSVEVNVKSGRNIEITDWQLSIYGPSGLVRTYTPDRRIRKSGFFGSSKATPLPAFFYWNGRDEKGQRQADGRYRLELRVTHDYNAIERFSSKEVWIETTLPEVQLSPARLYVLRPALADGKIGQPTGEILIDQTQKGSRPNVSYTGRIVNTEGKAVETRHWKDTLPPRVAWNGMIGGDPAPVGVYRYELEWRDMAGNRRAVAVHQLLVLAAARPPANMLFTEAYYVNPASMYAPAKSLSVGFTGVSRPSSLLLRLREGSTFGGSAGWKSIRSLNTTAGANLTALSIFPENSLPGLYELRPTGDSVAPVYLMLDTKRPELSLNLSSSRYRPGEVFRIRPTYKDASPLYQYRLRLLVVTGKERSMLREWKGDLLPDEIQWNGDTDVDHDIAAGEELLFEFEATDAAGHTTVLRSSPVRTDVRFAARERDSIDLIADLSLTDFAADSFASEANTLIEQIYREWSDLDGYSVRVRVFVSFQGEEEENLLRSEALARRIRDALVQKGIPDKSVVFRGEGETDLVSEAADEYSEYRNNRVRVELLHKP